MTSTPTPPEHTDERSDSEFRKGVIETGLTLAANSQLNMTQTEWNDFSNAVLALIAELEQWRIRAVETSDERDALRSRVETAEETLRNIEFAADKRMWGRSFAADMPTADRFEVIRGMAHKARAALSRDGGADA